MASTVAIVVAAVVAAVIGVVPDAVIFALVMATHSSISQQDIGKGSRRRQLPVASCQSHSHYVLAFFPPVLRADCPFLFLFPTALLLQI